MFSELVDEVAAEIGQTSRRTLIESALRLAITQASSASHFLADNTEISLTPSAVPHVYEVPRGFKQLLDVRYTVNGGYIWPIAQQPNANRLAGGETDFYYRVKESVVFSCHALPTAIDLYVWLKPAFLKYYASGARPAVMDQETGEWTYLDGSSYVDTLGSDLLNEAAQDKVSNWLLRRWYDSMKIGTLSNVRALLDGTPDGRDKKAYALWQQTRSHIAGNEPTVMATEDRR